MRGFLLYAVIILDRMTKYIAYRTLLGDGNSYSLGFVSLRPSLTTDTLLAWMPQVGEYVVGFAIASVFVVLYAFRKRVQIWQYLFTSRSAYGILLVAILSNIWDQQKYGGVIDFIQIGSLTTNIADIVIVGSAAYLTYSTLRKQ